MEEIAWKCSAAFLLGAATHYLISHHLQGGESAPDSSSSATAPSAAPPTAASDADAKAKDGEAPAQDGEDDEFESDDSEWEDMDEQEWQPHKMVLCVRTDLKMGKGIMLICCCYCCVCVCEREPDDRCFLVVTFAIHVRRQNRRAVLPRDARCLQARGEARPKGGARLGDARPGEGVSEGGLGRRALESRCEGVRARTHQLRRGA